MTRISLLDLEKLIAKTEYSLDQFKVMLADYALSEAQRHENPHKEPNN